MSWVGTDSNYMLNIFAFRTPPLPSSAKKGAVGARYSKDTVIPPLLN